MRKVIFLLWALVAAVAINASVVTLSPSTLQQMEAAGASTQVVDGVTFALTNGLVSSTEIRIYKNETLTLSSELPITQIVFQCTASGDTKYGPGCFTVEGGEYSYSGKEGTWTGNAQSVSFLASTAQVRATSIEVYLSDGDSINPQPGDTTIVPVDTTIVPIDTTIVPIDTTVIEPQAISIAEALSIGEALEDNASTAEEYILHGFVSAIGYEYSEQYGNETFWITDEPGSTAASNAEGAFYVYRGKPDNGKAIPVGAEVQLTTTIKKYVKSGAEPVIENTNANLLVQVLNLPPEDTTVVPVDTTVVEPQAISIAEALSIGDALEDNASTAEEYILHGFVSAIGYEYSEQYGNETFWITDEPGSTAASNAEGAFYVYRGKPDNGQAIPVGAEVQLTTTIKKYVKSGAEPVIENTNANLLVQVLSLPQEDTTVVPVDTALNYSIYLYAPDACPEMKPGIIGTFTNWEYSVPMGEALDEKQQLVYIFTLAGQPGDKFKFRDAASEDWSNEILFWDDASYQWVAPQDNVLGEETEIIFDWSDNNRYRFTLCGNMPVDTIEPQPADVPTTEDLVTAGYNVDSALVACFKFDGVVCDDIVFTGTFNGWSENPDECAKFQPLEGFEGWYVVEVPFAIDSVGSLPEGKPVQLQNGEFNWAYQAGDYWIYRGGNEVEFIERAPYIEGEVNVAYPSAGAYIYEIAYWKNFNTPCFESKTHTYVFDIYGPDACPEMRLGVAGSFNDWDLHAIPMDLVPDTTGKLLYTVAILAEEGQEYKFKEANDTTPYWDNELLYWDEGVGAWWAFKNFVFPQAEEEEVHIAMDLSDNAKYRFALCDGAGPQPIDTTEVEVIKPFVMTFNGTIDDWYIGDRASYNESASDPEANKYVFDILGGEPNDAYYKPLPDVLYRTKNTADKQKAFAIHPERCFEFGGKNGVLVIRNTQADDMIWIEVAAKGSSAANFQDEAGLYPVNAAALTEDLILPAKGSDGADEMGYVWRTLEFKSLGGDVEIKEFTGGYRVRSIILDREEQPVDTTVIPEDSVRNYAIYLYAPDACPEMKPAIIGTFTNWEYAVPMEEALDEKQQLVYTFVLEGKPGDRFKFREASSEAWENEIQEWSPMYEQWINLGDNELGEETAWFFNFSNNSQFRFTLCDAEPQPNYITCAEAVALMPADIGAETEKVYAVAGYVTEVLGNMSPSRTDSTIMQQRFWMDDEKGTAHTVQGYWCNLPGYEALNVGDRIVLTGKILNYNGTAEIKNGDVEIIERAPVDTTVIEPQAISIAEALSIGEALEDNASTTEEYILHGFVSAIATEFSEQYGNETFWITDEPGSTAASNAEGAFYVYRGKPDNGQAIPVGAEVQLTTTIKKYVKSGAEPVIENTNANLPVQVLSLPVDTTDYYLIRLYAPDACPEMKPAIIGMFTGWEYAIPMNEEIDENQRTVFTYQLYAEAGTYFKFREASSEAWENEIQRWDEEWQQWVNLGDNLLGEEKVITFDFSDNSMYRFTLCDNDVRYPVFFLDWEGSVISEQEVRAYGAASAPADPYREGFVFTGWSKPFNRITDRLFTVAMYIESSQLVGDHLVNFVDGVDGSLIDTTWVTLNVPAPMPHVGYSFIGWEVVAGSLENDITIKAVYESAQGVNAPEADAAARKVVRDGHLFILSGEKEYTATGMEVK